MIWFILGAIPFAILAIFGMIVDESFRVFVFGLMIGVVFLAALFSMGCGAHQMGWI